MGTAVRRSTSLTMDRQRLDEARELGVNVSRAAEKGVSRAMRRARRRRWREEDAAAVADYNAFIAANGVPFATSRKFRV